MKVRAIVLAAGFGTRMGALGQNCPKGLLDVGGMRVMDPILADLDRSDAVSEILWVSNARFADAYRLWLSERAPKTPWRLLDDGATDPESRLGATGDLALALSRTSLTSSATITTGAWSREGIITLVVVVVSTVEPASDSSLASLNMRVVLPPAPTMLTIPAP